LPSSAALAIVPAMTLPLYLAIHLAYGCAMGFVLLPRMRAEGEVIGVPLVVAIAPIGLLTAPIGAVLLRYAGGWFLHGSLIGDGSVVYERFHLGLMVLVGVLAGVSATIGLLFVVALLSRDRARVAQVPYAVAIIVTALVIGLDGQNVWHVAGTKGRVLATHPVGLFSVAVVLVLASTVWWAKRRLPAPPRGLGGGTSSPPTRVITA
jgi:hypothetical protein